MRDTSPTRRARLRGAVGLVGLALGLCGLAATTARAQPAPRLVRVFLDCQAPCDEDYVRQQIPFVEYVRDREDSEVHVLITRGRAGEGSVVYTVQFLGRGRFSGLEESLRYVSSSTDTVAEERAGLTQTIRLGLVRYVARTPTGERVRLVYDPPAEETRQAAEVDDPWKGWVFRTGVSGNLAGEEVTQSFSVSGSQSASHVSEGWKGGITLEGSYARSEFEIGEETITSSRSRARAEWLLVRTIGEHWGLGFRGAATTSSFDNYDLFFRLAPAVEYNVFPYSEYAEHELRFLYSVGLDVLNYEERTIFGVTEETLHDQTLSIIFSVTEPWGTAIGGIEASSFLDDFDKNRLTGFGFLEVRVLRGLSLFVGADASRIRDQINLPAAEASEEEILLRERVLSTPFSYSMEAGLSFTFGSIYSRVVNTRFGD